MCQKRGCTQTHTNCDRPNALRPRRPQRLFCDREGCFAKNPPKIVLLPNHPKITHKIVLLPTTTKIHTLPKSKSKNLRFKTLKIQKYENPNISKSKEIHNPAILKSKDPKIQILTCIFWLKPDLKLILYHFIAFTLTS